MDTPIIHSNNHGRIKLIMGPMFASKSTSVIAEIRKNIIAKKRCAIIKFYLDVRYTNAATIISHSGESLTAMLAINAKTLKECHKRIKANKIQVIGIDEGQFFPDIAVYADKWANAGISVIVSALDGDYLRKPFPHIVELIPKAENIVKLWAICARCCDDNASFTHRIVDEGDKTVVIGGTDKYIPLCRSCYNVANTANATNTTNTANVANTVNEANTANETNIINNKQPNNEHQTGDKRAINGR